MASGKKDWLKFKYGITRQFSILICKGVTTRLIVMTLGTALGEKQMEAQNRLLVMTKMTNIHNLWICFSYQKDILKFALPTFNSKRTKSMVPIVIILLLGALSRTSFELTSS